jgi:hypothetical protein
MDAVGTTTREFLLPFLFHLSDASQQAGKADERGINFLLSFISGMKPRDQAEAMLAAQMGAVHLAAMKLARRLGQIDTIPQQDSAGRLFVQLTRTYAAQMESFKRYRSGGEQKVTVQHVHVNKGGQAIVGDVTHEVSDGQSLNPNGVSPEPVSKSTERPMRQKRRGRRSEPQRPH